MQLQKGGNCDRKIFCSLRQFCLFSGERVKGLTETPILPAPRETEIISWGKKGENKREKWQKQRTETDRIRDSFVY